MARPTLVAWVEAAANDTDNYYTINLSIPATRAVDDLELCWVGSHSGSVNLPAGFTEISRPFGGAVLGYRISTVAGGGTATATSGPGAHATAVLALFRGAETHTLGVTGLYGSNNDNLTVGEATAIPPTRPIPVVGFVGMFSGEGGVPEGDGLHVVIGIHRFGGEIWTLYQGGTTTQFSPVPSYYRGNTANWSGAFWTRNADDAPSATVYTTASTNQMIVWNVLFA